MEFCPLCGAIKSNDRRHCFCSRTCADLWGRVSHLYVHPRRRQDLRPWASGSYQYLLDSIEQGQTIAQIAVDTKRDPEDVKHALTRAVSLGRAGIVQMWRQERMADENHTQI